MCKEMMTQRNEIGEMFTKDLERCIEKIKQNGGNDIPSVLVDLEALYVANKEYFEHQGFFFDVEKRIENNHVHYYAWLKLGGGGNGELGKICWYRLREAREDFVRNQRQNILDMLRDADGGIVCVDMRKLCFENKIFFQEEGYYFEPDSTVKFRARIRKHKKRES